MSDFEPRAAAKGTTVTVVVGNEERELKATKRKNGWAITPQDAAEAAALAQFSDEALDPSAAPPPAPAPTEAPEPEPASEPDTEAGDGQEESEA